MDRNPAQPPDLQGLIRQAESSRLLLAGEIRSLRHRLDVPARLRGSVRSHPSGWFLGSLGAGLFASLAFRRKSAPIAKSSREKKGLALTLLGLLLAAARPLAKTYALDLAKQYFARQQASDFTTRARPGDPDTPNPL